MKKIGDFLFSSYLMAGILVVFALSIAVATFIENDFGSASARAIIYHAPWFQALLFLGVINLTGSIIRKKLYLPSKLTLFVFHVAFILILLGAAITHYFGFEGTVTMREGESSDKVLTNNAFISMQTGQETRDIPAKFSTLGKNRFSTRFSDVDVSCVSYTSNAVPDFIPDPSGKPMADLVFTDSSDRKDVILAEGETKEVGKVKFSFSTENADSVTVRLYFSGDTLLCQSPFDVIRTGMSDQKQTVIPAGGPFQFLPLQLYTFGHTMVVMRRYIDKGRLTAKAVSKQEGESLDALEMKVSDGKVTKQFVMWGKAGYTGDPEHIELNGKNYSFSYGSVYTPLPFTLKLNDFIVERYPGSNSPSWYESKVELIDNQKNIHENRRIFMNNILNYRGYRFYQSSYTPDEKGTILSVNRDWAGTWITYLGYLSMAIGMALSLINKNSRFRKLSAEMAMLAESKKSLTGILMLLVLAGTLNAQDSIPPRFAGTINKDHADLFGRMLVQDNSGRFEPVSTLSSEVLRKLYRKNTYNGLSAEQVFIGMLTDPERWQNEPIIRTTHPQIQELMGSKSKYFPFSAFFRGNDYILHRDVENAFRKKPAERDKFDNEIIRLDERVNICYMVFTGELLRILPVPGDSSHSWYNYRTVAGKVNSYDSVFLYNVIPLYIQDVHNSQSTGDWKEADEVVKAITRYQQQQSKVYLPSPKRISAEIWLNKTDIFPRISAVYGIIGFILLILQFTGLFYKRLKLKIPVRVAMVFIIIAFILHGIGLGLRWYVSGHAPWSNGYEALTYISWACVLAGLIFSTRNSIALSASAILAFMLLGTAHLSWMDPQITNLVPVLKSYWLVIHVATITASYAFLGLGALIAGVNLLLMIFVTRKNFTFIDLSIRELSIVIELTLIVGLYMLTIGTFLGGVWANESWGRYWGWDPKETWAMVTVLVYAFIVHMRMVPGLRGTYAFNLASLLGFSAVIMTYFGVNFYLSGLHSYAKGDPLPIPPFVYYTLAVVAVLALTAFINYRKLEKESIGLERV